MLAATWLKPVQLTRNRALLRELRLPGERRIHFKHERDSWRREIAARLVTADLQTRIHCSRDPDTDLAREFCLQALVARLVEEDARRLVIESRDGRDVAERAQIGRLLAGAA